MGALVAIMFWADIFVADPVPYLDEIALFLFSFALNARNKALFWTSMTMIGGVVEWMLKLP